MQTLASQKLKILLVAEQCNPEWSSVPFVAYKFFQAINQIAEVTLVTHERNKSAFENKSFENVIYIPESQAIKKYYQSVVSLAMKGRVNWPLYHLLSYPIYAEFNGRVYNRFKQDIIKGKYDIVHALTPMLPRYPYKIIQACQQRNIPFILGPVNGGIPFPEGFQETAKKENAGLNFLRAFGRYLIPGYIKTYKQATHIFSGSTYTLNLIQKLFKIPDSRISVLSENGINKEALIKVERSQTPDKIINLLFVGRLVPYKCADVVVEAIGKSNLTLRNQIQLTIVGDGSEREHLQKMVEDFNLQNQVKFIGWVPQQETVQYYQQADIFCFPSVREFGGAVAIEAMACGLPCIVVNYGGIGEYVTEKVGFKIEPRSREYLVQEMQEKIRILVEDSKLRSQMSVQALERAKDFFWSNKALKIYQVYESALATNSPVSGSEKTQLVR
ncbi:MAG: glycosyltransferase family 4 protein [Cyanobacteriota bacterium]|nr:glycosyltransferase family 4 protein [Cyanobacteriota bacterium]